MEKAIEFVKKYGQRSLNIAVENAPSNAESYWDGYYFRENPQFEFNNGFHPVWNLTENEGDYFKKRGFDPIPINDLKQIVEAFELVESYGGLQVSIDHLNHRREYGLYQLPKLKQAIELVERCNASD